MNQPTRTDAPCSRGASPRRLTDESLGSRFPLDTSSVVSPAGVAPVSTGDTTSSPIVNAARDLVQPTGSAAPFQLRRAMERLREGLFDPLAVRLLTADEARLKKASLRLFARSARGGANHLCIIGAYGQGKSHSLTWLEEQALANGFVASRINLDPREVPFYDFRRVYRALTEAMRFPDEGRSGGQGLVERWRTSARSRYPAKSIGEALMRDLPESMPHPFRCALTAVARQGMNPTDEQKLLKERFDWCRPRTFRRPLYRYLSGFTVPAVLLRRMVRYYQVPDFRQQSLAARGSDAMLELTQSLGSVMRSMGYRGWVLLFDEGESIAQLPINGRNRSYRLLHRLLSQEQSSGGSHAKGAVGPSAQTSAGVVPVFAFTDDFFECVRLEDYERTRQRGEQEVPYFEQNYHHAWKDLALYRLQDLSARDWRDLMDKLMVLHGRVYAWKPEMDAIRRCMEKRLVRMEGLETRLKLRALVDELDLEHQQLVFAEQGRAA